MYELEQSIFPEFPRTEHLPAFGNYTPNASSDDKIAPKEVLDRILTRITGINRIVNGRWTYAEEKIDGANSGIMHCPSLEAEIGQPFMLRNRNHILRKGYTAKTKGKQQFIPFWNWYYSHVDQFEKLNGLLGYEACVYGEWLWPDNPCTIIYDKAPSKFIAYDVWDYANKRFDRQARIVLTAAGFDIPPMPVEPIYNLDQLLPLLDSVSPWAASAEKQLEPCQVKREGLYIKVCEGDSIVARYKMVRPDYKPGLAFSDNKITKKAK